MGVVHYLGLLCLLASTALLVVVSVSTPLWDRISFLTANLSASIAGQTLTSSELRMGMWGVCVGNACSATKLGYNLDFITDNTDGNINLSASVIKGLTYALVLNPIAAGVVFVAFLFGLFSNTACGVLASIMSFFAFLVTIVALALDLGLFVTARHRLNDYSDNINAMLGNAIWLVVAAAILQLIAAVTVCFTSSSSKRAARRDAEARPLATGAAPIAGAHNGRRGWFGRNKNTNAYGQNNAAYDNTTTPVMNEKRHFWQRGSKTGAY